MYCLNFYEGTYMILNYSYDDKMTEYQKLIVILNWRQSFYQFDFQIYSQSSQNKIKKLTFLTTSIFLTDHPKSVKAVRKMFLFSRKTQ